jgi:hypothetical protein
MIKLHHIGCTPYISSTFNQNMVEKACAYLVNHNLQPINTISIANTLLLENGYETNDFEKLPYEAYQATFQTTIENQASSIILFPDWKIYEFAYSIEFLAGVKKKIYVFSFKENAIETNCQIQDALTYEYAPAPNNGFTTP